MLSPSPATGDVQYVRALEIPTPRWTAYDAVKFTQAMPGEVPNDVPGARLLIAHLA